MQDIGRVEEGQSVGGLHCQLHQLCRTQVSAAVLLQVPGEKKVDWGLLLRTHDADLFTFNALL